MLYIVFTLVITEWRMVFRRTMNDLDSKANTRAIDSLINYETVKYFGNEELRGAALRREHAALGSGRGAEPDLAVRAQFGQSAIIADRRDADHVARDGRRGRRAR